MPSLGADMDEGTLVEWLVHPGDTVHKGDVIAVVDTAKAAVEVECFASGVIGDLLVQPGQGVPGVTGLTTISTTGSEAVAAQVTPAAPIADGERSPLASPLIRRFTAEHHVDLSGLAGTGPGGRVTYRDVKRAAVRPAQPVARLRAHWPAAARRPRLLVVVALGGQVEDDLDVREVLQAAEALRL